MDFATEYAAAMARGIKPVLPITVSEWADANRILSTVSSREPGQWRTSRTPYLREVMDCLSSLSPVERVIFMASSQIGKTEVGLNWLGYIMAHDPGPILMVQPSLELGKTYSKQRLAPMVHESTILRDLVGEVRSRDSGNTMLMKEFPGGILRITGSNSAAALAGMPVRWLFLDEADRFEGDVGGEGDAVNLAIQRTANFSNRKILIASTPTIKGHSRIEKLFALSDQRYYWVPCPHCGHMQVLKWAQVKWPKGEPAEAYYLCIECQEKIHSHHKDAMLEAGKWIPSAVTKDGKTAGFHISALYNPHGWLSLGEIAVEYYSSYRDPFQLKVWMNTKLGELWEESAEGIESEGLLGRREKAWKYLPVGVLVLTASVDVQGNRLEVEVVGWGMGEESWSVDYVVLMGDPSGTQVWHDLESLLTRTYPHSLQVPDMKISAVAIDTGGHNFIDVANYCRPRQGRKIWAIKGRGGQGVPIWPKRPSNKNKGRVPLYTVGVDSCKEAIYARLKIDKPGPGYMHFTIERDGVYFDQLTSEKVSTTYRKGRAVRTWVIPDGVRNEALDCRVYALAALHGLYSVGLQLVREEKKMSEIPMKEGIEPVQLAVVENRLELNHVASNPSAIKKHVKKHRRIITSPWMS
ncbi:MAG: phage terminase large subunit family protein [Magnetococcales bacterium]|nr:phage terminase large subunit family protein [Magnetococcales bacterium]